MSNSPLVGVCKCFTVTVTFCERDRVRRTGVSVAEGSRRVQDESVIKKHSENDTENGLNSSQVSWSRKSVNTMK